MLFTGPALCSGNRLAQELGNGRPALQRVVRFFLLYNAINWLCRARNGTESCVGTRSEPASLRRNSWCGSRSTAHRMNLRSTPADSRDRSQIRNQRTWLLQVCHTAYLCHDHWIRIRFGKQSSNSAIGPPMFTASSFCLCPATHCGRVVEFRLPHAALNGFPLSHPPEEGPPYVKIQLRFSTSPVQFLSVVEPRKRPSWVSTP
jgi:hypothetical protein